MINLFQPALGREELSAVQRVFESNWTGRGKLTEEFESNFASYQGVSRSLIRSVNSCTEGLFQSIELLRLKRGHEVILPAISFVGAANAVAGQGLKPVFCDVNPRNLNTTAEYIERKITSKTRAVILLHYGGLPCDMDDILALLRRKKIALIEDSACSVASRYKGKACGTFGDIGVWSFDSMKILVTGDGGMLYCRDEDLAREAGERLYMGLNTSSGFSSFSKDGWWQFEISCFGRRAIMNDISSAIGLEQLKKLPVFISRRKHIHDFYSGFFCRIPGIQVPEPIPADRESSYYFYWVQTPPDLRDRLARYLKDKGIYSTFRYYPLHWVARYGVIDALPGAEGAARSTLCIPLHHSLGDEDVNRIADAFTAFHHSSPV